MMQNSLQNFEVLDYRKTVINDYEACQQLHRFQTQNGLLQQVQTFLRSASNVFAITGTATAEEFHLHTSAFKTIVENFKVKETDTFG